MYTHIYDDLNKTRLEKIYKFFMRLKTIKLFWKGTKINYVVDELVVQLKERKSLRKQFRHTMGYFCRDS
jgi:hypothetical protein